MYINNVFLYNFITGLKFKVQTTIIRDYIYNALEENKYLQIVKIMVPSRDEFDLMLKAFPSAFSK